MFSAFSFLAVRVLRRGKRRKFSKNWRFSSFFGRFCQIKYFCLQNLKITKIYSFFAKIFVLTLLSGCFFYNILTAHFLKFGALVMVHGPRPNWTRKKSVIFFHKKESLNQLKITNILFNAFVRTKSKRVKSVQMFSWGTITKLVSKLEHNHAIQTQTDFHKSHRVK